MSVSVSPSTVTIQVGASSQLTASTDRNPQNPGPNATPSASPNNYDNPQASSPQFPNISYESSDTSVAQVSASGVIKGIKVGSAVITARSGSSSATCSVSVTA